jgi:Flp pilus assembly protein TadG
MNMRQSKQSKCNDLSGNRRQSITPRARRGSKQRGQALLELALTLPILLLLTLGLIELGRLAYYNIEVSDAARAGVQFGTQSLAYAADTAGITTAAQSDAPDLGAGTITVTPVQYCDCPGTGSAGACPAAGCSYPLVYLKVTTTYTYTPLFNYLAVSNIFNLSNATLSATYTLTGNAIMPVRQ